MPSTLTPALFANAIHRYFEISLYLLVVTAFSTLVMTGKLDSFSLLIVLIALLGRGSLLLRNTGLVIPEKWTNYLTLSYIVFYLADYYLFSRSFVSATVHLVLFSIAVKIFSIHRERDYVYLAILAFLMVLASAVLTVDTAFLAGLCIFILLAVSTFASLEMRRSYHQASSSHSRIKVPARFGRSLFSTALAIMLAIILGSAGIFFIIPRVTGGYLSAYAPRNLLVSGFSDEVRLGEIGRIQQTDNVIMHAQFLGGSRPPADLKWRGVALGIFDGRRWFNPGMLSLLEGKGAFRRGFELPGLLEPQWKQMIRRPTSEQWPKYVSFRVILEPIGTNVYFLPENPVYLQTQNREIAVDSTGSVFNPYGTRFISNYTGTSRLSTRSEVAGVPDSRQYVPRIALDYLQLPKIDARVLPLAKQITLKATTSYEKAEAIEFHLRSNYGYTLQLPSQPETDPIAHFLFERKAGHCEYFSSAMAVMLRTLGIPSRVVNGFRNGEFNDLTGSYIIRGKDAHSWVEAYFPGYGWASFDPTPPAPQNLGGTWSRLLLYVDAAREFWREWIINYDFSHQSLLSNRIGTGSRAYAETSQSWINRRYKQLLEHIRVTERKFGSSPGLWSALAAAGIFLSLLIANLHRIYKAIRRKQIANRPERAPVTAASIWYQRMTERLAKYGWRKASSQTAEEFVRSISDAYLRQRVSNFTSHYEHARFGTSAQAAARLPELYRELEEIEER